MLSITHQLIPHGNELLPPDFVDANYQSPEPKAARWKVYDLAEPTIDLEQVAANALGLAGQTKKTAQQKHITDIGTGDARLLYRLRDEFGMPAAHLTGVDPNVSQFKPLSWPKPFDSSKELADGLRRGDTKQPDEPARGITFHEGRAESLPFLEDDSADALFAMFMFYHVPEKHRDNAIAEFKRVLKPDGTLVMATSGERNKERHRSIEKFLGHAVGSQPPFRMNAGWTSERATAQLPGEFEYVYKYSRGDGIIHLRNDKDIEVYLNSVRSLYNQYRPIPAETMELPLADEDGGVEYVSLFEYMLKKYVVSCIHMEIAARGSFIDESHRSLFLCSDSAQHGLDTRGFERIT